MQTGLMSNRAMLAVAAEQIRQRVHGITGSNVFTMADVEDNQNVVGSYIRRAFDQDKILDTSFVTLATYKAARKLVVQGRVPEDVTIMDKRAFSELGLESRQQVTYGFFARLAGTSAPRVV